LKSNAKKTLAIGFGSQEEAVRKVKAVALQVLADMVERGEEEPESLKVLFAA
jgi:hypothetical protein